ncbi:serine hydrolase [Bacillus sp. ISL-101]|uniref:serine hydrolase domain-containing protein n=1 Tax=unclassified Bacillus (in: firmicutes) TaxID=185979 RepID=UPI001BE50E17|nr:MULTISPECIES: serine hydrolase domain-containing protein [unclassified Bacillus (in: firmicutes)]MBT2632935.1 serine hydrolase [Bacillus sp. ISL-101]MBT2719285.1 serine hydrolase [Bacillus sp. ISL-57]
MKPSVRICMLMIAMILAVSGFTPKIANAESSEKIHKIDKFVEKQRIISKIPGLSVVIVEKGKTVYQEGFGYADVKAKTPVTSNTLFEIGSTTKAFTGLAILQLEKEGLLKRSDDVRKYIPWLKLKYNGEPQTITLNQLLHHTSGIASNSIAQIPESNAGNALELNVRTLLNQQLNRKPGSSFEYATLNYDVLGLVIEVVTKQPYEIYMKKQILEPIGMKDSFVGLHQVQSSEMASGYKIGFMREQPYSPPIYRGNVPAGYIISNTNDIAKWMKLQLGNYRSNAIDKQLIQELHIPDQSVEPFDKDTYYASGWAVMKKNEKQYIFHAGENPTFTSYFIMQPDEQIGVAILSNMNTSFTTSIGQGVMDLWEGNNVTNNHSDRYQKLDRFVTILCIVVGCFGLFFILLSLRVMRKLVRKQRIRTSLNVMRIILLSIHTLFVAAILTLAIMFPKILLGGFPWTFIKVWAPTTITVLFYSVIATSIIYYLFGLLLIFTKNKIELKKKQISIKQF